MSPYDHAPDAPAATSFSLTRGGPFYRVLCKLGLSRHDGRDVLRQSLAIIAVGWLPLELLSLFVWTPEQSAGFLRALSIHARFLVALPLILTAEQLLEVRCNNAIDVVSRNGFVQGPPDTMAKLVAAAERLRDSRWAELLLLIAAFANPLISLHFVGNVALVRDFSRLQEAPLATLWYGCVSLPVLNFLLGRWLWRWLIWTQLLWRMSRRGLSLIPTHPDHAGGIATLSFPSHAVAVFLAALSCVLAASWASQILFVGMDAHVFLSPLAALLGVGLLLAFGPVAPFARTLWRERLLGKRQYTGFAADYTRRFHERWIVRKGREDPLGSHDISGLAHVMESFEHMTKMRPVPFGREEVVIVLGAMVIPVLPVSLLSANFKLHGLLEGVLGVLLHGG